MFYIRSIDGVKIAVYDVNRKKGNPAVVLVHGWPLSHKMFEYQIPALISAGYRVVSLDLRGFGNSDAPAGSYSYDQMATDLYYVVRALKLNRFVLLGFYMGGAVATRYMASYHGYGVKNSVCVIRRFPHTARPSITLMAIPRKIPTS